MLFISESVGTCTLFLKKKNNIMFHGNIEKKLLIEVLIIRRSVHERTNNRHSTVVHISFALLVKVI